MIKCTIGVSIGIAVYPIDGNNYQQLISKADIAMYKVKESNKGHYLLYQD